MLQSVTRKFRSGCMMLARRRDDTVDFLGSAFLVARQGYLLTVAHLVGDDSDLVVVPSEPSEDFLPLTAAHVAALPVSVVARDIDRDVALLRIDAEVEIGVPDDFLGSTAALRQGSSVMALGYSYGHEQVHTVMACSGIVSAKVLSRNDTALILFNGSFRDGDRGGPLVHVDDGHVIGIISGAFDPGEALGRDAARGQAGANFAYAVAIEYGLALMERL